MNCPPPIWLRYSMFISFAAIPLGLILFYGLEDENADFFTKGDGIAAEYKIIYNKQSYHLGEMTSEKAAIVCVSLLLGMVSFIAHYGIGLAIKK